MRDLLFLVITPCHPERSEGSAFLVITPCHPERSEGSAFFWSSPLVIPNEPESPANLELARWSGVVAASTQVAGKADLPGTIELVFFRLLFPPVKVYRAANELNPFSNAAGRHNEWLQVDH